MIWATAASDAAAQGHSSSLGIGVALAVGLLVMAWFKRGGRPSRRSRRR